jgi:hypothetical protein
MLQTRMATSDGRPQAGFAIEEDVMTSLNRPTVVMRSNIVPKGVDRYLRLTENGASSWIEDLGEATVFDSMRDAQREVEQWAQRMQVGGYSHAPQLSIARHAPSATVSGSSERSTGTQDAPQPPTSLFDRMRTLLPKFSRARSDAASNETIERLRRSRVCRETDTGNLHFAANE